LHSPGAKVVEFHDASADITAMVGSVRLPVSTSAAPDR